MDMQDRLIESVCRYPVDPKGIRGMVAKCGKAYGLSRADVDGELIPGLGETLLRANADCDPSLHAEKEAGYRLFLAHRIRTYVRCYARQFATPLSGGFREGRSGHRARTVAGDSPAGEQGRTVFDLVPSNVNSFSAVDKKMACEYIASQLDKAGQRVFAALLEGYSVRGAADKAGVSHKVARKRALEIEIAAGEYARDEAY